MLSSLAVYSHFIYTLLAANATIKNHTIRIYPRGALVGVVEGNIEFEQDIVLRLYERVDFARQQLFAYSYEVWHGQQQLYWYDPTPHPHIPELQPNHPHHKHVPPDIKHHRVLALRLSFMQPNLPFLIEEIEQNLLVRKESDYTLL